MTSWLESSTVRRMPGEHAQYNSRLSGSVVKDSACMCGFMAGTMTSVR